MKAARIFANDESKNGVGVRKLTPTYVLTRTIKGWADTTRQLARAYAQHTRTIQALQQRVVKLEGKGEAK